MDKRILQRFSKTLDGEFHFDQMMRSMYATDASLYHMDPLAVCYPKTETDIQKLIAFCNEYHVSLIPRTAGTSLAGQCVGKGIVVDVSKHFNQILEVNKEEGWVKVQPGVVRDHLNIFLKPHGLFFGPNTATANRAMIGGMVGNNSCGSYSIVYGTTRDHVLELTTYLSDGNKAIFGALSKEEFRKKSIGNTLEAAIYRQISFELNHPLVKREIEKEFPKASVKRRNTGYAVDFLIKSNAFETEGEDFNFCKLLSGSEGSLCFFTEIKLHVDPLPPSNNALLCAHFKTLDESLKATVLAMQHHPRQCELMDKVILDCTKENITQNKNRFFIEGDPGAILMIEFGEEDEVLLEQRMNNLIRDLKLQNFGYAHPVLRGGDIQKALALRAAGLGVLSNVKGAKKPVEFVEDTAVAVEDLPEYIKEYELMLQQYDTESVYYAHAGAGELHLRPILDLKTEEGVRKLRGIATDTAKLVKKFGGSLSGEHGDGIVRAEFIPLVLGEKNYQLFKRIKYAWDPNNIFNPGKIVDASKMDENLRTSTEVIEKINTTFDFSDVDGILSAVEKCSGSGDCRKTILSGGTMCPSYMATKNEKDTTRARANVLREFLTRSNKKNKFNHPEIKEVMDLCISCKGCKSECPSNVDMAAIKAEFLHQYHRENPPDFRTKLMAEYTKWSDRAMTMPMLSNLILGNSILSKIPKKIMGIHQNRSMPKYSKQTLRSWWKKNKAALYQNHRIDQSKKVYLFCDEFTNCSDLELGKKSILLLLKLGYAVDIPNHKESGRSFISKGFLTEAKALAEENVQLLSNIVHSDAPLIGIEPSCILSFRDEYPKLVNESLKKDAHNIASSSYLMEEFIAREMELGKIVANAFKKMNRTVKLHGHCHQKAMSSTQYTKDIFTQLTGDIVEEIPSGCCGMAGSFGYEKEHFELSNQIGELVLFPSIRATDVQTKIMASGTSCRHQILDGTMRTAQHPVELLFDALA